MVVTVSRDANLSLKMCRHAGKTRVIEFQLRIHLIKWDKCGEDPDFEYIQVRGGGQIVLKGLYSGFAGNLVGVLPYVIASAIFIGVYEPKKQKLLKSWPENINALAHLTACSIGGAASSIIRVPTEVVTQRMQTEHFASASVAVRLIVKGLFAVAYNDFVVDGSLSAVREKGL
ncbi:S-adenosylmethionine carrier 1, chloroplastic/mitochondrial-like protein isoform X2, partial [Tanacetum coccineum]